MRPCHGRDRGFESRRLRQRERGAVPKADSSAGTVPRSCLSMSRKEDRSGRLRLRPSAYTGFSRPAPVAFLHAHGGRIRTRPAEAVHTAGRPPLHPLSTTVRDCSDPRGRRHWPWQQALHQPCPHTNGKVFWATLIFHALESTRIQFRSRIASVCTTAAVNGDGA